MLVEPIMISGRNADPLLEGQLPAAKSASQDDHDGGKEEKRPDLSDTASLVAEAQDNLNMIHSVSLSFKVHEASGKIMVTVRDESTGEVIREIPPAEILNIAAKLDEMIGLIFDQKA
jgi:flagellar protein FlaG